MDNDSLAHKIWECKHRIVFAAMYRRQAVCNDNKSSISNFQPLTSNFQRGEPTGSPFILYVFDSYLSSIGTYSL